MMQSRFNTASASRHYRQLELASRVSEASPHALVSLLYEELLNALDAAIAVAAKGVALKGNVHLAKARSILSALEASLDFENGGELAPVLARVYRAAGREISDSVANNAGAKLPEVRAAISNIVYAWAALTAV